MYLYMMRVIRSINCHAHRLMFFLKICKLDGWMDGCMIALLQTSRLWQNLEVVLSSAIMNRQ
jgi:hypothetical protein